MTRKKFVKQLMAMGYQRNAAEAVAIFARIEGCTYEQYLQKEKQGQAFNAALEKLKTCLNEAFATAAKAIADAVERIREIWEKHPLYGIDWANGPDLNAITRPGLYATEINTDSIQAMSREDHDALRGGGGHE